PPKPVVSYKDGSRLSCEFSATKTFSVQYQVEWVRGNITAATALLQNGVFESLLSVDLSDFSAGQKHFCSVRACYSNYCPGSNRNPNGTLSDAQVSDVFLPEIV
ncbi:hypothetical protein EGW08_011569, partial [Elysia chlorotica]